jgi:hypothetical protein
LNRFYTKNDTSVVYRLACADNGNILHEDARVGFSDVLARKQEGTKLKPTTISSLMLNELC